MESKVLYEFDETKEDSSSSSSPVTVFYNLYVPSDEEGVSNALAVLTEQMEQLGQSSLTRESSTQYNLPRVYYNLVGNPNGIPPSVIESLCQGSGLDCHLMHQFPDGTYEEVTLDMMHQYCSKHDSKGSAHRRVIYFHSKGSYHDNPQNRIWRKNMLEAITSPSCLDSSTRETNKCNLCGLLFFPVWQMIMPGNFFVSHCGYVSKLLSPLDYKERLFSIVDSRRELGYSTRIYNPRCYSLGLERFAAELWIGSHPELVPCDLAATVDINYWKNTPWQGAGGNVSFALAPRIPITSKDWQNLKHDRMERILQKRHLRLREYFLLPGVLYRYAVLYQQLPKDSSWIWQWFPDGKEWKTILASSKSQPEEELSSLIRRVLLETPKGLDWWWRRILEGNKKVKCTALG